MAQVTHQSTAKDVAENVSRGDFDTFRLSLIEGASYIGVALFLGAFLMFLPDFSLIATSLLSLLCIYSYVFSFNLSNRAIVGVCSLLGVAGPIVFTIIAPSIVLRHGMVVPFANLISCIFLLTFAVQIFTKKLRVDIISTVAHTVCLSLFTTASYGYVVTNNLFDGLFTPFLLYIIAPFIAIGVFIIFKGLVEFLKGDFVMQNNVTIAVGAILAVVTIALLRFVILNEFSNFVQFNRLFLASIPLVIGAWFIVRMQFGTGKYLPAALLRVSFPLATCGVLTYVVALFAGVGV
ncbi:MAG: hypothetical protein LBC50_02280 [Candidatus Ancillula sp.]|nr:hypothetical protein [Candidatus Ancillula sp.]